MLKKLINLFFPETCLGCQNILHDGENLVCTGCRYELPLTQHLIKKDNEAYQKFYGRIPIEHASAMFYYHKKGIGQQLIHNLKYKSHIEIGTFLGTWYGSELRQKQILKNIDFIIPVPLHQKRWKERGYNQVDSFCEALAQTLEIPIHRELLFREQYSHSQSKKGLLDRNKVNQTAFVIKNHDAIHTKHFLLVDDVLTTGATLEACGKALLQIPNAKISIITIAFSQS